MNNIEKFLSEVRVIDTETTGLDPKQADIIELGYSDFDGNDWTAESRLYSSKSPIPPFISVLTGISNYTIANKPLLVDDADFCENALSGKRWYIAHNAEFDAVQLANHMQRANRDVNSVNLDNWKPHWICTLRIARKIYDDLDERTLGFLRYSLDLDAHMDPKMVSVAHRTDTDVYVNGHLLVEMIGKCIEDGHINPDDDIGEQLHEFSWAPPVITKFPFGKHKGVLLTEVPDSYYLWALNNMDCFQEDNERYDPDLSAAVAKVIESRFDK